MQNTASPNPQPAVNIRRRWSIILGTVVLGTMLVITCLWAVSFNVQAQSSKLAFSNYRTFGLGFDCTYSLAVGDLNGDGSLDLLSGNTRSLCDEEFIPDQQNLVALNQRAGRQSGHFPIESLIPLGRKLGNTLDVALGDMNGDGALDVVLANGYVPEDTFPEPRQSYVYLNDGMGNFNIEENVDCTNPPTNVRCFGDQSDLTASVAVADLNSDGWLDIVAGSVAITGTITKTITGRNIVYINDGTGNFQDEDEIIVDTFTADDGLLITLQLAIGNLDNKDSLDIVAGTTAVTFGQGGPEYSPANNFIYYNVGSANFKKEVLGPAGVEQGISRGLALGDLDGDEYLDIVVGNGFTFGDEAAQKQMSYYYLNDQEGNFNNPISLRSFPETTLSVDVGDMNNDGHLDIVTGNFNAPNEIFLNDGTGNFPADNMRLFGTGADATTSVLVADVTGDSALDIVVGNIGQDLVYLNNQSGDFSEQLTTPLSTTNSTGPLDIALADINSDAWLDIIFGNNGQNVIYTNNGDHSFTPQLLPGGMDRTERMLAADMDQDQDIDLIAGNWLTPSIIYWNNGTGIFTTTTFESGSYHTSDLVVGDLDGDSDLDIGVTHNGEPNSIYFNDGRGRTWSRYELGANTTASLDMALGDIDSDGDLDLAVSNQDAATPNMLYLNPGNGQFQQEPINCDTPQEDIRCFGSRADLTTSLNMADVNGDGALDIIEGNSQQPNKVYINGGGDVEFGNDIRLFGTGADLTIDIDVSDVNGDGFIDLIVGNGILNDTEGFEPVPDQSAIYFNNGNGDFPDSQPLGDVRETTMAVAVGDLDGNGTPDYVKGNWEGVNQVYFNHSRLEENLINNPPYIQIDPPYPAANTDSFASPLILENQFIPITYRLFDAESDPVAYIKAYYSLDGGDNWQTALPSDTEVVNLTTHPSGTQHIFLWDIYASGFFGKSDNVVFRIEAYPQPVYTVTTGTYRYMDDVPGPYQRPYAASNTFPFRVRGTQVRVLSDTADNDLAPGASVYRFPQGEPPGAVMTAPGTGRPWLTDFDGYLAGSGRIDVGDGLVALFPVTYTRNYTLYHTNMDVSPAGLGIYEVEESGVQTLTVSADDSLILFNLVVSLEWDARGDESFLNRLEDDLQRTSQRLFDLTNGQAALGNVYVYHDKGFGGHADVVIRASNNQRPSAVLGGSVSTLVTEPIQSGVATYIPGQVSIGPTWNRFGEPSGVLGEDWPLTLAHELGHYLFFLPDNYLGIKRIGEQRILELIDCPGSFMTDPYQESYSEALTTTEWNQSEVCQRTLAQEYLGRSDWETIGHHYPITATEVNSGPNQLPLLVTQIRFFAPDPDKPINPLPLADTFFSLVNEQGQTQAVPQGGGEAYLIKTREVITPGVITDDYAISLGTPVGDKIHARGAGTGDRLCAFDFSREDVYMGCLVVEDTPSPLTLNRLPNWRPRISATAINSYTVAVTVTNVSAPQLFVQVLPALGDASEEIRMNQGDTSEDGSRTFTQTITFPHNSERLNGAYYGFVRVWVPDSNPPQEMIAEYLTIEDWGGTNYPWPPPETPWGGKAYGWGGKAYGWGGKAYGWGGKAYAWGAPIMSTDGQVSIFPFDDLFDQGQDFTLQRLDFLPGFEPWLTVVGNAYRVERKGDALPDSAILFRYLPRDVPPGREAALRVYYLPDEVDNSTWQRLATDVDEDHNHASATVPGPGTYALIVTVEVTPILVHGWNPLAYSVQVPAPLPEALHSIAGKYTAVAFHNTPAATWLTYYPDVVSPFENWVNTLSQLEPDHAYQLYATATTTLYLDIEPSLLSRSSSTTHQSQLPPATFYGWVTQTASFTPGPGTPVTAWINNTLCGQGRVQQLNGRLAYVIQVTANDGSGEANGCGQTDRVVTFKIGEQIMPNDHHWHNYQACYHPLGLSSASNSRTNCFFVFRTYMPVVERDSGP